MHTPMNKLIVRLSHKLYDSRQFESGQTIYFDPSWHPEEYAMLEATVVTVPPGIIKRQDYKGYKMCVKPGDSILIRYDVVFSYYDQPDRDTPRYKNLIFEYNEKTKKYEEYWLCDILQIFAIKQHNEWQLINGFVMLDIITETKSDFTYIIMPDSYKSQELKDKATIIKGGENLGLKKGDTVYINPGMVMRYQFNLKPFYIIKEKYILAKAL